MSPRRKALDAVCFLRGLTPPARRLGNSFCKRGSRGAIPLLRRSILASSVQDLVQPAQLRFVVTGDEDAVAGGGAGEFLARLASANIPFAILTRNSRAALELVCRRLGITPSHTIAREDAPPKPDPTGLLQVCRGWGVRPDQTAMIGDYHFDLDAGRNAGSRTVLYLGGRDPATLPYATRADLWLHCFTKPEPMFGWLGW